MYVLLSFLLVPIIWPKSAYSINVVSRPCAKRIFMDMTSGENNNNKTLLMQSSSLPDNWTVENVMQEYCQKHGVTANLLTTSEKPIFTNFLTDFFQANIIKSAHIFVDHSELRKGFDFLLSTMKALSRRDFYIQVSSVDAFNASIQTKRYKHANVILSDIIATFPPDYHKIVFNDDFWLIKNVPRSTEDTLRDNFFIPIDGNVYLFNLTGSKVVLREAYNAGNEGPLIVRNIGAWSNDTGLILGTNSFWERRKNLMGTEITATAVVSVPYIILDETNGQFQVTGMLRDMWDQMELQSNFTTRFVKTLDGKYGGLTEDGVTFNGMVGMLQSRKVDVAINGIAITESRARVADPLNSIGFYESVLYYKSESSNPSLDWLTFISPFDSGMWLCIFLTLIVYWLFMVGRSKLDKFLKEDESFGAYSRSMVIVHAWTNQGTPFEPANYGSRIVFLSLFLTATLSWFSFSAVLTSYLTAKLEVPPFLSLADMYLNTGYNIVTAGSSIYEHIFKTGSPLMKQIHSNRMTLKDNLGDSFEQMSQTSGYAIFGDLGTLQRLAGKSCSYKRFTGWSMKNFYSFYVQKNSPYRDLFNYLLSNMREAGQISGLMAKWKEKPHLAHCGGLAAESLGIEKMIAPFVLLSVALIVSFCIFIFEKSRHWMKRFEKK